jgi:hypothetical protein
MTPHQTCQAAAEKLAARIRAAAAQAAPSTWTACAYSLPGALGDLAADLLRSAPNLQRLLAQAALADGPIADELVAVAVGVLGDETEEGR